MQSWQALPAAVLKESGEIGVAFTALGLMDYRAAARYIGELPYGRNADRADFRRVLAEQRGTCSTKHALLAALAAEQHLPVGLFLGLYAMTERNTPGVGAVLSRYGLDCIPEAHCYLIYSGERIDVTRVLVSAEEPIAEFLHEEQIRPEQIGAYKVELHQCFLRRWSAGLHLALSWEQVWQIREACIAALAEGEVR